MDMADNWHELILGWQLCQMQEKKNAQHTHKKLGNATESHN